MAKMSKQSNLTTLLNHNARKKTSIGGGTHKLSSMNKHKKASYKPYRGQGR